MIFGCYDGGRLYEGYKMNTRKILKNAALGFALFFFTACGGGGGGNTTAVDTTPPVIPIGIKKTGQTVSFFANDDGDYQKGLDPSYTRDDATNIVTDHITQLQWQDNNEVADATKIKDFVAASAYCANLTLGTHTNWRVPSIDELMYIADRSKSNPAIEESVFEFVASSLYWSSTTVVSDVSRARVVNFLKGSGSSLIKGGSTYLRCVRDG
jgi:hypothetical protein